MKVKILGWNSIYNRNDFIKVNTIWVSPGEKYLIVERYKSELYVSARIIERTEEGYICQFVECYEPNYVTVDWRVHDVEWDCLEKHGFCKLKCFEMESGFDGTEHRFWFEKKSTTS